jgi:hypothetical protein
MPCTLLAARVQHSWPCWQPGTTVSRHLAVAAAAAASRQPWRSPPAPTCIQHGHAQPSGTQHSPPAPTCIWHSHISPLRTLWIMALCCRWACFSALS